MVSWLATGVDLQSLHADNFLACYRCYSSTDIFLACYRCRIYGRTLTDMPWLDTGIESGISRLQICPGWIQVSSLRSNAHRYALAGYRNRIWNLSSTDMPWLDTGIESEICRLQICPGWVQVSNLKLSSIDMPWLDTSIESLNSSCRYALARYRCRIHNQSLADMP